MAQQLIRHFLADPQRVEAIPGRAGVFDHEPRRLVRAPVARAPRLPTERLR